MRRRLASLALALAALTLGLAAPRGAHAAERQVTFDRAGRITRVDEALARRLGMFIERYEGFREARLFMLTAAAGDSASDSTATNRFVLEITILRGGQLLRERELYTTGQVSALRADVESRMAAAEPERDKLDQEGRPRLLLGSATLGLGFYGWAVPYVFEVQDGSQAFGAYLLTAGASCFLPMMLTAHARVTVSDASLYWYGSTRGIVHGLLLNDAVQGNGSQGQSAVATAMITSLLEGSLGYAYARSGHLDAGTVQTMATGGDYGLLWGFSLANLTNSAADDFRPATSGTMLITSLAGIAGGRALAAHRAYSNGDAAVMRSAGFVGLLAASAVADIGDTGDGISKSYATAFLAGSLTGLAVGDRLVAGREFTAGDGLVIQLGASAGALMGLGIVAVVNPQGDTSTPYLASAAVGSALGYAMAYSGLSRKAVARSSEGTSWRFEIAPEGVMAALRRGPERGTTYRAAPTLARVSWRF